MVPVTLVVLGGMAWAKFRRPDGRFLADLILYVGLPCLIFANLSRRPPSTTELWKIALVMTVVFATLYFLCWVTGLKRQHPEQVLAVIFPNAGNLGIPLAALAFGEEAKNYALVFFTINSILHFTWGFGLAGMKVRPRQVLGLPLIYAVGLGLWSGYGGWRAPWVVMEAVDMTGAIAIPLMLVALGLQLAKSPLVLSKRAVWASSVGLFGGLGAAWVAVWALGLTGNLARVALVYGALPSAVFNVALMDWAAGDAKAVADTVAVSTLMSAVLLSVLLFVLA